MSATTFATAYTSRNSEVARKFHGVASEQTIRAGIYCHGKRYYAPAPEVED